MDNSAKQPMNLCCLYKYDNGYNPMSGCVNPNAIGQCPIYNEFDKNSPRMEQTTYEQCMSTHPNNNNYQWNGNLCNALDIPK